MAFFPPMNSGEHRAPPVVDLHRGGGPAGVDGLRHLHQVGNRSGIVQPHLLGVGAAGVQVHDYVPHRHQGAAAGRLRR